MAKPSSFILRANTPEGQCDAEWEMGSDGWSCTFFDPPLHWMCGQSAAWVKNELLAMGISYAVLFGREIAGNADMVALEASLPQFGGELRILMEAFGPGAKVILFEERVDR